MEKIDHENTENTENHPLDDPIELDEPIVRGDQTIASITVRKPDAGTLRGVKLSDLLQLDTDAIIAVAPRVTTPTLTKAEMQKMDPADLVQLGTRIAGFLVRKRDRFVA